MSAEDSVPGFGTEAPGEPIAAARALGERGEWQAAFDLLGGADEREALDAEGLALWAECARWAGRTDRVVELLERAHHASAHDPRAAVRTALSLCYTHMDACEPALAAGWWRRADELIAPLPEGPEHGLHAWYAGRSRGEAGDLDGHEEHARRALEIGQRYGDRNVEALALIDLGHVATVRGRSTEALELLDRATTLALGGEIGVLETGLVYCNAILACRARGEWDRAQQWTNSATRWVARAHVSYFPGLCRVHRAEVLRVRGELPAAESEALEAVRLLGAAIPRWIALAYIELGEVRRRRGDLAGAFEAYRLAHAAGWDPQPGLSLLILAQGDPAAAHRGIERFSKSRVPTLACEDRAGLLRARVTIAIAAGELQTAGAVLEELDALAEGDALPWDLAARAQAHGELALASADWDGATDRLHLARALWAQLDAPYELATTCVLLGKSLAAGRDASGAALELEAARGMFERLGAALDLEACEALLADVPALGAVRDGQGSSELPAAGLRREGEYWTIDFGGDALRLKDSKGVAYLARLLAHPGREQLALELAGGAGGVTLQGDAGELLDGEALGAYRERLVDLQAELERASDHDDLASIERLRAEIDALTTQLVAAVGLGGRVRRAGDPHERARQSVTKALRGTIRRIAESHELLGRYLTDTIRTGVTCRFDPDPGRPLEWHVEGDGR